MIFKNTLLMGGTTVVRLVAGFFVFVLAARYLGASAFGTFVYWTTVAGLIAVGINFGTGPYMLKELGAQPQLRLQIVGQVGAAKLVLTALAFGASLAAAPFIGAEAPLFLVLLAMASGDAFSEYAFCAFRGGGDYLTEVWMSTLTSMLHLALVWLAIACGASMLQLGLVFAVSRLGSALAALLLYRRRYGPLGVRQGWRGWPQALKANRSYALDALLTNVYSQLDSLLLNHLSGPAALGVYQAGMRLLQGLNNVAPVLSNVYLPKLAAELHGQRSHRATATLLYLQLVGFGLAVAVAFTLGGNWLANLIYGAKFDGLGRLMPWIGLLLLLRLFASNYGILLTASGQQSARVWAICAAVLALAASAAVLVPRYGALGMIWSAMAATAVLAGIYYARVINSRANPLLNRWMQGGLALTVLLLGAWMQAQTLGLVHE